MTMRTPEAEAKTQTHEAFPTTMNATLSSWRKALTLTGAVCLLLASGCDGCPPSKPKDASVDAALDGRALDVSQAVDGQGVGETMPGDSARASGSGGATSTGNDATGGGGSGGADASVTTIATGGTRGPDGGDPVGGSGGSGTGGAVGTVWDAAVETRAETSDAPTASTTTDAVGDGGAIPSSEVLTESRDTIADQPLVFDSPDDASTNGTGDAAPDVGPAPTSCNAWVRRLQDQCPEDDTFLGYVACATGDGHLRSGQRWRWALDAFVTRPSAAISPPDPHPTPADCTALPRLHGDAGLPATMAYYCESHPTECGALANDDQSKTLKSMSGAWTLVGAGTTGEGFMSVTVDGQDMGKWSYVILSRTMVVYSDAGVPIDWPTPQVAVLYWNGFVRLKTPATIDEYGYGTSLVLGPFAPVDQDPTEVANPDLHPRIEAIAFDSTSLAGANPVANATGGWYSGAAQGAASKVVAVTWQLSWPSSSASEVQMHVATHIEVLSDFSLPSGELGMGSLSSMWASLHTHDSDTYSIGPTSGPVVAGSASAVPGNPQPVNFRPEDQLSFTTTTSTDHNSGSPDIAIQFSPLLSLQ